MKTYKPRKLIPGHVINEKYTGMTLVGVPQQKFQQFPTDEPEGYALVNYEEDQMIVKYEDRLCKMEQEDKFNPGSRFFLVYFEWKPLPRQEALL